MEKRRKTRNTRHRQLIKDVLSRVYSHPTAVELYEMVKKEMPGISLSTVYRNLERLASDGMALRLDTGKGPARFDGRTNDHYHIRCIRCGRVDDVPIDVDTSMISKVRDVSGYTVLGCNTEFYGLCPLCRTEAK
ncbi:MAG: transcriptional repressor [Deltaproteobacteria bacterium]|nr:transcriptional repressor [Deltaproteobacteria bacterium]